LCIREFKSLDDEGLHKLAVVRRGVVLTRVRLCRHLLQSDDPQEMEVRFLKVVRPITERRRMISDGAPETWMRV